MVNDDKISAYLESAKRLRESKKEIKELNKKLRNVLEAGELSGLTEQEFLLFREKFSKQEFLLEIAKTVLQKQDRPLHQSELAQIAEKDKLVTKELYSNLARDFRRYIRREIKRKNDKSVFVEFDKRFFGLRGWRNRDDIDMVRIKRDFRERRRRQKYDKYGFTYIPDHALLKQIKEELREIKIVLRGLSEHTSNQEIICFWVWLCYRLEMYREAAMLFRRIPEDSIEKGLYKVTEKIALACEAKLRNK